MALQRVRRRVAELAARNVCPAGRSRTTLRVESICRTPRNRNRGARRRLGAAGVNGSRWPVAGILESLEDRLLLSASFATPSFVIEGHSAIASGSSLASGRPTSLPANSGPITPAQMQQAYGVNQISLGRSRRHRRRPDDRHRRRLQRPEHRRRRHCFNSQFGLQQFNVSGGPTFKVLNENGGTSLPANSAVNGWDVEESLDVEWAHSIAPQANIILFEANSNSFGDLLQAVSTAADTTGVSVVSMSWSGGEWSGETSADSYFTTPSGHQGVTFLASTGDNGTPSGYPALSPERRRGRRDDALDRFKRQLPRRKCLVRQRWRHQRPRVAAELSGRATSTGPARRTAPFPTSRWTPIRTRACIVLDTYSGGWFQVGGTSLSSPMFAGLVAIADQGRALQGESSLDGATQTLPDALQPVQHPTSTTSRRVATGPTTRPPGTTW